MLVRFVRIDLYLGHKKGDIHIRIIRSSISLSCTCLMYDSITQKLRRRENVAAESSAQVLLPAIERSMDEKMSSKLKEHIGFGPENVSEIAGNFLLRQSYKSFGDNV